MELNHIYIAIGILVLIALVYYMSSGKAETFSVEPTMYRDPQQSMFVHLRGPGMLNRDRFNVGGSLWGMRGDPDVIGPALNRLERQDRDWSESLSRAEVSLLAPPISISKRDVNPGITMIDTEVQHPDLIGDAEGKIWYEGSGLSEKFGNLPTQARFVADPLAFDAGIIPNMYTIQHQVRKDDLLGENFTVGSIAYRADPLSFINSDPQDSLFTMGMATSKQMGQEGFATKGQIQDELIDYYLKMTRATGQTILIYFYTQRCSFCRVFKPMWDQLRRDLQSQKDFVFVEIDGDKVKVPGVNQYPTLWRINKGSVNVFEGRRTPTAIRAWAESNV